MIVEILTLFFIIMMMVSLFVLLPLKLYYKGRLKKAQGQRVVPTLICPTCHVMAVDQISTAHKVGSAAAIGLFSLGRLGKSFRCRNCGYVW